MSRFESERHQLHLTLVFLFFVLAASMQSCKEKPYNPNTNLSLDYYSGLDTSLYSLSTKSLQHELERMAYTDTDTVLADYYVRSHYLKHRQLVWIGRTGIDDSADSVLLRLKEVSRLGFNPDKFRLGQIEKDLKRVHNLDFDTKRNNVNAVFARLEYNLTKAYFRFAAGQYFGFTNPAQLLNRLDRRDTDAPYTVYNTLYGYDSPRQKSSFFDTALRKVHKDSATVFLDSLEPRGNIYKRFIAMLNGPEVHVYGRRLLLVNIERCRWRMGDYPYRHSKYIISNIPSFRLRAVDGDKVIVMRMGCGSKKTKTPLLHSYIDHMDINPQWIMPRSIVRKSIIPRLGNRWYFRSKHYFLRDRATGQDIEPSYAARGGLENGNILAIQEGGEGNSLGRIIFRFNNGFSIYLHDTSSRSFFANDERDVSHGCIRVEKPYQLAEFLLGDGNERMKARIKYSMNADVSPLGKKSSELTEQQKAVADTLRKDMLIGRVEVKPAVPLFIVYFTLFPDADGTMRRFGDIYGYDEVIFNYLRNFL